MKEDKGVYATLTRLISYQNNIKLIEEFVAQNPDLSCARLAGKNILYELMSVYFLYLDRIEDFKKILKLFIAHNVDPNERILVDGSTILHCIASTASTSEAKEQDLISKSKLLIENGSNPFMRNKYDKTAADVAEFNGNKKLAGYLKEQEKQWVRLYWDDPWEVDPSLMCPIL